jgi:hypothetical protein
MTAPIAAPLPAMEFQTPLVNPGPSGLYAATTWVDLGEGEPLRWLGDGVRFWPHNYGGEGAVGIWDVPWCGDPGSNRKDGTRPDPEGPFAPVTVWAYDECDMTAPSQAEVRERAQQNLRLLEQTAVEREFAERLLADAGSPFAATDITDAVGFIEAEFAKTNTVGLIHASAQWAAAAVPGNLAVRSSGGGTALKSPMGHTWVFGGGYVDGLGDVIVGTSPTYGWRGPAELREAFDQQHNRFLAIAERSLVIGYEKCVASAEVTP